MGPEAEVGPEAEADVMIWVAADIESGPQEGSRSIPAFSPLNLNGAGAGKKVCQV